MLQAFNNRTSATDSPKTTLQFCSYNISELIQISKTLKKTLRFLSRGNPHRRCPLPLERWRGRPDAAACTGSTCSTSRQTSPAQVPPTARSPAPPWLRSPPSHTPRRRCLPNLFSGWGFPGYIGGVFNFSRGGGGGWRLKRSAFIFRWGVAS